MITNFAKFDDIKASDIVTVADIEWIALKKNEDSVFCLTKDFIDSTPFDPNSTNYATSEIRTKLQKFATNIKSKVGEDALISRKIDLTTEGKKHYGTVTDDIGLLTKSEYEEFKSILEDHRCRKEDPWYDHETWLATANSEHGYDRIWMVDRFGKLYDASCDTHRGIRPACLFSAEIFEK